MSRLRSVSTSGASGMTPLVSAVVTVVNPGTSRLDSPPQPSLVALGRSRRRAREPIECVGREADDEERRAGMDKCAWLGEDGAKAWKQASNRSINRRSRRRKNGE